MIRALWSLFLVAISLGFLTLIFGVAGVLWYLGIMGRDLPDYSSLKDYDPPVVTRVHTGDGRLMAEFSTERRVFVPITEIPPMVVRAFVSAEDQNFYVHAGVDFVAVARAAVFNLMHAGRRPMGASTITQQVAKNFLLSNEVSYERKVKEALLAFRLEKVLSKDRLLELYLNQIYLGSGNYGVAAAALSYFNKSLSELTPAEAAYLAALPKAPNSYHPDRNPEGAMERRNYVLSRMYEDGVITREQEEEAKNTPITFVTRRDDVVTAPYFAEEIRRVIKEKYGLEMLYRGGLSVRSTIDPHLQDIAQKALRDGLMGYDMKRGFRGPVTTVSGPVSVDSLNTIKAPNGMLPEWALGVVSRLEPTKAHIILQTGDKGIIPIENLKWARRSGSVEPKKAADVLNVGDVVMLEPDAEIKGTYMLRQIPRLQGAIVAMDPHTGRVLAMQGGWTFEGSEFNRVTQAYRQPGSAFKPFIYLAALDHGFTPTSLVLDGPIVYTDALGRIWRPENYTDDFLGPSTLRVGIEKSRNLMTIRLAERVGMDTVVDYAKKFGISDKIQPHLANALGSTETTLLRLTAAYGMLVNGGRQIEPHFIDRIQGRRGQTIYRADARGCVTCGPRIRWEGQGIPELSDTRVQIEDPRSAYQMVSIMEGVVQRGTAKRLSDLGRPIAGKTGTTNESRDVWFVGFTPDLVAGVFVGFDTPRTLGDKETGGSLAVPIFREFMSKALDGTPAVPFRVPSGIRQVLIDARTGHLANYGDPNAIWEAFTEGTEPTIDRVPDVVGAQSEVQSDAQIGNTDYTEPPAYVPAPKEDISPYLPPTVPEEQDIGDRTTEGIY